jgi:hypothetical protein
MSATCARLEASALEADPDTLRGLASQVETQSQSTRTALSIVAATLRPRPPDRA